MRNAFVRKLTELAEKDERIVLLTGDLGFKIFDDFQEKFPNRFYNVGIAEANMVTMASGLALAGMKPFVYSIAPFVTLRCAEQIRNDLCYNYKNVVVVGAGGGYTYGHNGPTHHTIEDIALFRAMPNIKIVCPGDPIETELFVQLLAEQNGPAYLRIGRAGDPLVHSEFPNLGLERGMELFPGKDVTIISTGNMLKVAIQAARKLNEFMSCGVVSMPVVKPLDEDLLSDVAWKTEHIFTLEEHNVYGGLGSAVAEFLLEDGPPVNFKRLGIQDYFVECSGDQEFLRTKAGLDVDNIVRQIAVKCSTEDK